MDPSIGLGLAAALCWGTSDYVAKLSTVRIGYLRTATLMQYVGGALILVLAFQDLPLLWRFPQAALLVLGLSVVNVLASLSLLKSFEVGKLSIVSPIASSYPALSTFLAVTLLHEVVVQTQLFAIPLILIGIILVSLQSGTRNEPGRRALASGVGYALISFASMGLLYFALKIAVADLGSFLPVLVLRWMSAAILTPILLWSRPSSIAQGRGKFAFVAFVGLGDTVANIVYNLGLSIGTVAVVSTLSALFSPVTVLLACLFLKERLASHQVLGFLAILVGVSVIGYF